MTAVIDTKPAEEFVRADRQDYERMMKGEPFFAEVVKLGPKDTLTPRKTVRVREVDSGVYTGRWCVVGLTGVPSRYPADPDYVVVVYRVSKSNKSGMMQSVAVVPNRRPLLQPVPEQIQVYDYAHTEENFRLGKVSGEDDKDDENAIGSAIPYRDSSERTRGTDPDGEVARV